MTLLSEGAINRHKKSALAAPGSQSRSRTRTHTREVVINGDAYESSKRKLTRKTNPSSNLVSTAATIRSSNSSHFGGHAPPSHRTYKPKIRRHRFPNQNLVLNGTLGKPHRALKQCRFFSISGICNRGRTCPYKHDADKIAICPRFLQRDCPHDADSCPLSHDPTPERVPLCVHFANNGRCKNGETCLYPHVRVGKREGICRDFAVLGYCEKGLDCDKQHLRECPDFAEKGKCLKPQCKLPHVIRASRQRGQHEKKITELTISPVAKGPENSEQTAPDPSEEEFIPLTFHEDSDEETSSEDEHSD